ncbi:MAG: rod shape-determining protein MreC [Planctomycetes bacterium]|nr:rod shape-determining protein MreC [Planctomycetota bacterium]
MHSTLLIRWMPAWLVLGGVALTLVPAEQTRFARNAVRDALRPGLSLVRGTQTAFKNRLPAGSSSSAQSADQAALADEVRALQLMLRKQSLEMARLREKWQTAVEQYQLSPSKKSGPPPLTTAELVEARVLGAESAHLWRSKQILAAGSPQQIGESSLVLESTRPLVDVGGDTELATGDAVYAGRVVVGKIAEVGRYSSTLMLVTDPGYSGRARLARRTARGALVFGAEGTLVADGSDLCRLKHITDPVNVGDEVFTGGTDGLLPYPMYYGQVVRAELEPGAQDWSVWVKPAAKLEQLEAVLILKRALNPARILAN